MLNARTQRFFIWGAKKCKCGIMKGALVSREIYIYVFPSLKDEYPICIPIWIMFSSVYTRFSVRVNLVYDTNGSGDCKYYHTRFL